MGDVMPFTPKTSENSKNQKNLIVIESELVPVYETDKGIKVVNGRELHQVLQSGQDFSTWVKKRLSECDATENVDYERFHKKMEANNATVIEYIIKLETAKEMAMLERNEKGKQVRKYFISVEEKYKQSILDRSQLSPQMQMFYAIADGQAKMEIEQKRQAEQLNRIEKQQAAIKEAIQHVTENWREEMGKKIRSIQHVSGKDFQTLNSEMYKELEQRASCNLSTRLRNKRQRMEEAGCTKTAINNARKIDIIEENAQLRSIFEKIVSEYVIHYCA